MANFFEQISNLIKSGVDSANTASEMKQKAPEMPQKKEKMDALPAPVNEEDLVEYTYKPGDTFGQVIKDLGFDTDAGLWGEDGDVNYYTKQLIDQGVTDGTGNIPIGTTIHLVRRGAELKAPEPQRENGNKESKEEPKEGLSDEAQQFYRNLMRSKETKDYPTSSMDKFYENMMKSKERKI